MTDLDEALKKHFGFPSFRPNQRDIIEAILAGRDVFAALPTGGGKSLCYQLPAVMREGLTVVVSPLIALMKDQVDGAREDGIAASYLNSALSQEGAREVWRELAGRRTRLLYVSPERLSVDSFRASLLRLAPSFFAVDEAHCISEWGHEFRPDYRSLGLLRNEFPDVPIAAFTATATAEVQADVVRQLGLRAPFIVRASFDRPEIFYRVGPRAGDGDEQIAAFIAARPGQSGIVYRGSRRQVESTAAFLAARGVSAAPYHAGMEDTERHARQEAFVKDELTVIVATIAFGMGIDKSNVRWIVHGDLPRSLEGYYQETGRAARDGEPADTLLLYAPRDIAAARWHIGKMESSEEQERAETRLREILRYAESGVCRRTTLLAHFGEAHAGGCGRCDVCAGEIELVDLTVAAQKVLSAAARTGERFGAHHLADIIVGNATDKVMERGHEALPTFGAGRDQDREWWLALIRDLAAGGYLMRGEEKTSGFSISPKGRRVLAGRESFAASRARMDRAGAARPAGGPVPRSLPGLEQTSTDPAADEVLFLCLKQTRKRIAQSRQVPPYVVFSDKSLRAMARSRPVDEAAFLRCPGVGEHKLAAYGRAFMETIRSFVATGECGS